MIRRSSRPSVLALPPQTPTDTGRRRRGKPTHREVSLHRATLLEGAAFKGFKPYVVQELLIHNENTRDSCL